MKRIILGLALLVGLSALGACTENPQVPVVNGVPIDNTAMNPQPPIMPMVHIK